MAERLWSGFWVLALLNGFWILFSTHLGNTDSLVRVVTDILWIEKMRDWNVGSVRRLYYTLLILFTVWGAITTRWGTAMTLFQALGVVASLVLALGAVQVLIGEYAASSNRASSAVVETSRSSDLRGFLYDDVHGRYCEMIAER